MDDFMKDFSHPCQIYATAANRLTKENVENIKKENLLKKKKELEDELSYIFKCIAGSYRNGKYNCYLADPISELAKDYLLGLGYDIQDDGDITNKGISWGD